MENKIKSIQGWHESNCRTWDEYCKVGDICSEDVYWYFLNILLPTYDDGILFQAGGASSSKYDCKSDRYRNTYMTFKRISKNTWMYCGNLCKGERPHFACQFINGDRINQTWNSAKLFVKWWNDNYEDGDENYYEALLIDETDNVIAILDWDDSWVRGEDPQIE